jgi:putative glutamine transport system substrate-binding protein
MKKRVMLLMLVGVCLRSYSQSFAGDTWAQVKAKGQGEISLAYVETFGFAYKDNGKLTGVCIDIMDDFVKFVNEKKGVKLTSKLVGEGESFKGMYDKVKASSGGVFGLGNVTITDERKREVKFSPPFISNVAFLVSQTSGPTLAKMEELSTTFAGMTAYTAKGTLNEKRINELKKKYFPALNITLTANSQETLEKLLADAKGFAYLDLTFYLEATQQRKPLKRHSVGDVSSEKFGFVLPMNSDWQPVLEEFFKADGGYTNSAAYKSILRKHLGETGMKLLQGVVK